MQKIKNKFKKKFKYIFTVLMLFIMLFINIAPTQAGIMDREEEFNKKEYQLIKKIKIIHEIFPNQTDEAALYATLVHKGTLTDYVNDSYDSNFDENNYKEQITQIKNTQDTIQNTENGKYSQSGSSMDLLIASTIVMIDSSGWLGNYSDDNYRKALAGDRLVGNMTDENDAVGNAIAEGFNAIFCGAGALLDTAATPVQFGIDVFQGKGDSFTQRKASRYITMTNVCNKGFVGGTYSDVKNYNTEGKNEKETKKLKEQLQLKKNKIAEEIIKLAKEFRGEETTSEGSGCANDNLQAEELCKLHDANKLDEWIEQFGPVAQADYSRTGVFASVTIGQAIEESGWACSNLAKTANNLFGIKCGSYKTCTPEYRKYDSIGIGIEDHSRLFTREDTYYKGAINTKSPQEFLNIVGPIYCPASDGCGDYAGKIMNHIKQHDLTKWDVKINTTSSSDICSPIGMSGWKIRTIKPTSSDKAFNYVNSNRGQCVWYAQGRAIEIVEELGKNKKLDSNQVKKIREKLLGAYGNGGDIYDNTKDIFNGSSNIKEPKSGSYIVWKKPGGYGHVAIVEDVNTTDKTITITEGWATNTTSCPNSWGCVNFSSTTLSLKDFYKGYGKHYTGAYKFSGYVYFLEPK